MPRHAMFCITCIIAVGFGGLLGCSLESASETDTQVGEVFGQESTTTTDGGESTSSAATTATPDTTAEANAAPKAAPSGPSSSGFLWKPISEGDGNLVVLLPSEYRGRVAQTAVVNASGSVMEVGRFSGDTHNGNRPHYRFSMPGAGYGRNVAVVARLTDGSVRRWGIPNGAGRIES